ATAGWPIDLSNCATESDAREAGAAYKHLESRVRCFVEEGARTRDTFVQWSKRWWQPWAPRLDFFSKTATKKRLAAIPKTSSRGVIVFIDSGYLVNNTCYLFAYDDDYSFGVMQSSVHWAWAQALGSKTKDDTRYDR